MSMIIYPLTFVATALPLLFYSEVHQMLVYI